MLLTIDSIQCTTAPHPGGGEGGGGEGGGGEGGGGEGGEGGGGVGGGGGLGGQKGLTGALSHTVSVAPPSVV